MKSKIRTCTERHSYYLTTVSKMRNLCTECSHQIYGYDNCEHEFKDGKYIKCLWNGGSSNYLKKK